MSKVAIHLCEHELTLRSSVTDFSRQDTGPLYDNRYQKHARSLSEPHFNAAIDPTRSWDRLAAGSCDLGRCPGFQDPYSSRVGQLLGCKFCQKSTMSFRANISDQMLDTILIKRFEKRSGHQKVLKGEYVIEEGITGKDVSRENELSMCLRPGQKIDMSMIFSDLDGNSNHCPRCFTKSKASSETRTQWLV